MRERTFNVKLIDPARGVPGAAHDKVKQSVQIGWRL
jgi:hypothetical protein